MTIHLSADGTIELEGECTSDEAETLLRHLLANPGATVDWRHCESLHAAVLQVLMAARPRLRGPPVGLALNHFVHPWLADQPPESPGIGSATIRP